MTNITDQLTRTRETYLKSTRAQMSKWRGDIDQFEQEIKRSARTGYQDSLNSLKAHWNQVETRYRELEESGSEEWEMAKQRWQAAAGTFLTAFKSAGERLQEEMGEALGWLEGMADKLTPDTAGWAEGLGEPGAPSEGWVEGQGEAGEESKGWQQGYEQVRS